MRFEKDEKQIKKYGDKKNSADYYLSRVKWEINDRNERVIETRETRLGAFI